MAHQSAIPRGKSWSTGNNGSFSASATRWMKNERYLELKKLEQDSENSFNLIKKLEAEIRDLSTTFENLKMLEMQRGEVLGEIAEEATVKENVAVPSAENVDVQQGEVLDGQVQQQEDSQVERSDGQDVKEQIQTLKNEHEAASSQKIATKASLEQKRAELEILSREYKVIKDLIANEEKLVQAAELEESLQESVSVQHEMRSLSEDLGRLGRLMEGLKDSNADQLKQNFTRPLPKARVYHPVTSIRSRNHSRNGSASDPGRIAGLGDSPSISRSKDSSRSKEPAEFEEREGGGNRKRQKSSTFELERERIHEQRAKLEVEAKEKRRLLESMAGHSSQFPQAAPARGLSVTCGDSVSPSSVFEGFGETLFLGSSTFLGSFGPARSGYADLASVSSELSEFSVEQMEAGVFSSAAKRLDFELSTKGDSVSSWVPGPTPENTASWSSSVEEFSGNAFDIDEEIVRGNARKELRVTEAESEASSSRKGEVSLPSENGSEEIQKPAEFYRSDSEEVSRPEVLSSESGKENMHDVSVPKTEPEEMHEAEVVCLENGSKETERPEVRPSEDGSEEHRRLELLFPESGLDEIQTPVPEAGSCQRGEVEGEVSEELINAGIETDDEVASKEAETNIVQEEAEDEVEEIDITIEEFNSFGDAEEEEEEEVSREEAVVTTGNGVEEIDVPEEDIEDFDDAETANETRVPQVLKTGKWIDDFRGHIGAEEVSADDEVEDGAVGAVPAVTACTPELQQNGFKSAGSGDRELRSPREAGQDGGIRTPRSERRSRRQEAENQMMQLSSQLSLLQKQVEEEVELHEKSKNESQLERTSVGKQQLSTRVSFFTSEVCGLRQSIEDIQQILQREGGDLSVLDHWTKDLHSKCADQSAQLEHLGKQVSMLAQDLNYHLTLRFDLDNKLYKRAQESQTVEAQLTGLSTALAVTVSTIEKEEEAVGDLVEQQKHLLVEQLNEAEKLRHIAEIRVETLNDQIEQLEMVCDIAKNIQVVSDYQKKAWKYGMWTVIQLVGFAVGVIAVYARVAAPLRGSLVPT